MAQFAYQIVHFTDQILNIFALCLFLPNINEFLFFLMNHQFYEDRCPIKKKQFEQNVFFFKIFILFFPKNLC